VLGGAKEKKTGGVGRKYGGTEDFVVVVYYLLLQDRIEEAKELMERVVEQGEMKKTGRKSASVFEDFEIVLQYDYLHAYLDFCTPAEF
jgi:predicted nucleic acid-binding protein